MNRGYEPYVRWCERAAEATPPYSILRMRQGPVVISFAYLF